VLRPSGRFLALERRSEPGASGIASHGWTEDQAHRFAERCRAVGFSAEVGQRRAGRGSARSVLALAGGVRPPG
jgi:hypothetical protein